MGIKYVWMKIYIFRSERMKKDAGKDERKREVE
jgi:hypothetical protein